MGDKSKPSSDWKNERVSMTHVGNFSRSSSYVRSLVRQQFHNQSDQPSTAWERLRERLAKQGSYYYDEEMPSFMKKKKIAGQFSVEEKASDDEDSDEDEETFVFLKTANNANRRTTVAIDSGNRNDNLSPSHNNDSSSSARRLSAPPTTLGSGLNTEKHYTLPSQDAHSKILNRRLSLAESVIKNYGKYIRTPNEPQLERNSLVEVPHESLTSEGKPFIAAISEERSSPLLDVQLVNCPASSLSSNFLTVHDICTASSYTEPPSPAAKSDSLFFDVPLRRNSHTGLMNEDLSLNRSSIDVKTTSTNEKQVSKKSKLPRLSAKSRNKNVAPKNRNEAIEKLRSDHEKLTKNPRLKKRVGQKRETVYRQLLRDQERRKKESAIFNHEMEQITKTLKAINSRLDERIKVLDCADTPKVSERLQHILQVALAGVPVKNI